MRTRSLSLKLILLLAASLLTWGCGASGESPVASTSSTSGVPTSNSPSATEVPVAVRLEFQPAVTVASTPASAPRAPGIPDRATSVRVHLVDPATGIDVVPPQTVPHPSGSRTETVTFGNVPLGNWLLVTESRDSLGAPLGFSQQPVATTLGPTTVVVASADRLLTLTVTPASATIAPLGVQAFVAKGMLATQTEANMTSLATWTSSNATIATISNAVGSSGTATGVAEGTTTIQATLAGLDNTALLTVKFLPTVTSVDPADGATAVPLDKQVKVTFSKAIDSATLTPATVLLEGPRSAIPATVTYDPVTFSATLAPMAPYPLLAPLTVRVTTAVQDLAGNPLATAFASRFTTADASWQGAAALSAGDAPVQEDRVAVAVDPEGNAFAAWSQSDGTRYQIFANRYSFSIGQWGTPQPIEGTDTVRSIVPTVGVDAAGNATVAWCRNDGGVHHIYVNRYSQAAWGQPVRIDSMGSDAGDPSIALNGQGDAVVSWRQFDHTSTSRVFASRCPAGGTWQAPQQVDVYPGAMGHALDDRVVIDNHGNALVVWGQQDDTPQWCSVYFNRYDVNAGWAARSTRISDPATMAFGPRIAMDGSGNAVLVWNQWDPAGGQAIACARKYTASSGNWGDTQPLESTTDGSFEPRVGLDGSGNAIAIWSQDNQASMMVSQSAAGKDTWSAPQAAGNGVQAGELVVDTDGNAVVVYRWQSGPAYRCYASRFTVGGTWGVPVDLDPTSTQGTWGLGVAMNAAGRAVAGWARYDGAIYSAWSDFFR